MNNTTKSLNTYWITISLLLLIIITIGVWKLYQILAPDRMATATLNNECNLSESVCDSVFPDGTKVSLSFDPRPIPVLKPLKLTANISGVDAEKVEVDIIGIDINMGYIRPELSALDTKGQYSGDSILPVCILDDMQWEARVMIHTDNGLMVAPFQFVTKK